MALTLMLCSSSPLGANRCIPETFTFGRRLFWGASCKSFFPIRQVLLNLIENYVISFRIVSK